jgi:hypothetical protein
VTACETGVCSHYEDIQVLFSPEERTAYDKMESSLKERYKAVRYLLMTAKVYYDVDDVYHQIVYSTSNCCKAMNSLLLILCSLWQVYAATSIMLHVRMHVHYKALLAHCANHDCVIILRYSAL